MTLFERVKETAKSKGFALAELARRAGIGEKSIYTWKPTKQFPDGIEPKRETLEKVADVLGVSVDYLLGNTDEMHSNKKDDDPVDLYTVTDDERDRLISANGQPISDEDWIVIKALLAKYPKRDQMIDWLLNKIHNLDYDCLSGPTNVPAFISWERKVVIFNPDLVTPYYLMHEIIHIEEGHHNRLSSFNGNDERNPHERDAENEAIHRLMKHHIDTGGRFNYVDFMMIYGIPTHLEQSVITEMSDINMYAR